MSPMVWWVIPIVATLAAVVWTHFGSWSVGRVPAKPVPGSPDDRADLERFAAALASDWPGRASPRDAALQPEPARADPTGQDAPAGRD